VGNRIDLVEKREVPTSEGKALAVQLKSPFLETSAKSNINVQETFSILVTLINKWRGRDKLIVSKIKKPYLKTSLNDSFMDISDFPVDKTSLFTSLTSLDFSHNRFTEIFNLNDIPTLTQLNLSCNRLTSVPRIFKLAHLRYLDLSSNKITRLSSKISALSDLRDISLRCNLLTTIPEGILDLKKLNTLDLSYNELQELEIHPNVLEFIKKRGILEACNPVVVAEVRKLISRLHSGGSSSDRVIGAQELSKVAESSDMSRILIALEGGIPPLINLLTSKDAKIQRPVSKAVYYLVQNEDNRIIVNDNQGVEALVAALHSNSLHVLRRVIGALWHLVQGNDKNKIVVERNGGVEILLALRKSKDSTVSTMAADILSQVISSSYELDNNETKEKAQSGGSNEVDKHGTKEKARSSGSYEVEKHGIKEKTPSSSGNELDKHGTKERPQSTQPLGNGGVDSYAQPRISEQVLNKNAQSVQSGKLRSSSIMRRSESAKDASTVSKEKKEINPAQQLEVTLKETQKKLKEMELQNTGLKEDLEKERIHSQERRSKYRELRRQKKDMEARIQTLEIVEDKYKDLLKLLEGIVKTHLH